MSSLNLSGENVGLEGKGKIGETIAGCSEICSADSRNKQYVDIKVVVTENVDVQRKLFEAELKKE